MTTIMYEGPSMMAGLLAQMLNDEGLEVDYHAPIERRGGLQDQAPSIIAMTISGVATLAIDAAAKAAVRKFKTKFPRAKITDKDGTEID